MKSLPVAIVARMVYNKSPVQSRKLKYQEKSYQFSVFQLTKADFAKLKRIDGQATMSLGPMQENNEVFEIQAKSISIAELKDIATQFPCVGVMSIAKGTTSDTGERIYRGITAIAFKSLDDFDKAKITALKTAVSTKEKRDSQRTKLYKWESTFFDAVKRTDKGWKKTPLAKLKEIAATIIEHFKIPKDKVHVTTGSTKSEKKLGVTQSFRDDVTTETPNYTIINVFDSTPDTLIHELAHLIAHYRYAKGEAAGHGPEFCGIYAHTLGLFAKFEEEAVIKSMTAAGLKVKKYTQATKAVEEI